MPIWKWSLIEVVHMTNRGLQYLGETEHLESGSPTTSVTIKIGRSWTSYTYSDDCIVNSDIYFTSGDHLDWVEQLQTITLQQQR